MSKSNPTRSRSYEGIRVRHSRSCRVHSAGRCNCEPSYEAWVFLKRENRKLRKTFKSLAAAKAWRADALAAANRGKLRGPVSTTLRQAADAFLEGAEKGEIPTRSGKRYKPATLRGYRRALRLRVLPKLGDMKLSDVTRADVQDLADKLTGAGLAASTVQNTLDPVRKIFDRAVKRDLVAVDPTEGLELRRPDGRRDRIASPTEAVRLLAALPDAERALYATAMYAGLRRGELRALRWDDVDLPGRRINVERGWDDEEGEQDGKSEAARRPVPIVKPLARELAAHKLRTGRDGDALVFGLSGNEPFYPATVRRRALAAWEASNEKALKAAADTGQDPQSVELLEPIGLHESRHTCASGLIASGANAKTIQKVMGHASIQVTFDVYGHLMPGGLDEALDAFDAYLDAKAGAR
ncbi:MAG TPA: site-specific integrase [Solirubrobacter sp.]|nr:site-specific integrase [Solirubrobacter sp.]